MKCDGNFNETVKQKTFFPFLDDQNAQPSALNVLSAATTLALALQQCKTTPSPPDKETADVINAWLDAYMPVSCFPLYALNFFCGSFHSPFELSNFKVIFASL